MRFELKFPAYPDDSSWHSILQMSTGTSRGRMGSRNPAVFYRRENGFRIISYVNGNIDFTLNFKTNLPAAGKWILFEIRNLVVNGKLIYSIEIDGDMKFFVENWTPAQLTNVTVHTSYPQTRISPIPNSEIRILEIKTRAFPVE